MADNNQADSSSNSEVTVQTSEPNLVVTEGKSGALVAETPSESGQGPSGDGGKGGSGGTGDSGKGPDKSSGSGKGGSAGKGSGGRGESGKGKGKAGESKLQEFIQFMGEVVIEFKKVTWPTKDEVFRETMSVLVLVALLTVMVLAFDWVVATGFFQPVENWARMHGGGIGRGY
ncbi:MAG TPA: preprotein translocase subunit SecE [Planktothrix sp.]|jgi:preprotein translocase SecE subunit